jgi:hypothetical protein
MFTTEVVSEEKSTFATEVLKGLRSEEHERINNKKNKRDEASGKFNNPKQEPLLDTSPSVK